MKKKKGRKYRYRCWWVIASVKDSPISKQTRAGPQNKHQTSRAEHMMDVAQCPNGHTISPLEMDSMSDVLRLCLWWLPMCLPLSSKTQPRRYAPIEDLSDRSEPIRHKTGRSSPSCTQPPRNESRGPLAHRYVEIKNLSYFRLLFVNSR
jgi:hypothetical protein